MARATSVRVDEKGRLSIPARVRRELGIKPGDVFYLRQEPKEGPILHYAKAENPFDALAEHAIKEYHAGRTKNLRDFAKEQGISLDA